MLFAHRAQITNLTKQKAKTTRYFNDFVLITLKIAILHSDKWFSRAKQKKSEMSEKYASQFASTLKVLMSKWCQIIPYNFLLFCATLGQLSCLNISGSRGDFKSMHFMQMPSPFFLALIRRECKKVEECYLCCCRTEQEEKCIFFTYGKECKILPLL